MSHIFLYGPPGTGKSTLGKHLARNLCMPFLDMDRSIESNAGMSIAQIMSQRGEPAFREMETTALKEAIAQPPQVIALGGGALLREENRQYAETQGAVVLLMAEFDTLLYRLQNDLSRRPLLAGDLRGNLKALLAQRRAHYSSFPLQLAVDGQSAADNAREIQIRLGRFHLRAMGSYDVITGRAERLGHLLAERRLQHPVVVTDENIARLHAESIVTGLRSAGFMPELITIPDGEAHKNLETVQRLWRRFLEVCLDRKSTVIAVGGGMVSDVAGFAAATYMRGIPWVCVPTTLLSLVDASLGGKTGVDLPEGKNLIGSFHPPKLVLADPRFLETLPELEFISGLAEVVKHGVIADPQLFDWCKRGLESVKARIDEVLKRAMAVKIKIIEEDPYEQGFRAALNLGHTVGHALELASQFRLRHGEAVAIGLVAEARLAERLSLAHEGLADTLSSVLTGLGLPVQIPKGLAHGDILRAMKADKKKNETAIRFALPVEIGRVEMVEVSDLEAVL